MFCKTTRNGRPYARLSTLVDIPEEGTEVSIDYIWNKTSRMTTAQRTSHIDSCWGFDCACNSCSDPETTDADSAELWRLKNRLRLVGRGALKPNKKADRELMDENFSRFVALLLDFRMVAYASSITKQASKRYSRIRDEAGVKEAEKWRLEADRIDKTVHPEN